MKKHEILEKNVGLLTLFMALAVSIGGLTQIVPLFFQDVVNEPVEGMKPYTALRYAHAACPPPRVQRFAALVVADGMSAAVAGRGNGQRAQCATVYGLLHAGQADMALDQGAQTEPHHRVIIDDQDPFLLLSLTVLRHLRNRAIVKNYIKLQIV